MPTAVPARLARLGFAILVLASPLLAQPPRQEKASVEVATDRTSYRGGDEADVVVTMEIQAGWHTNSHEPTYEYLIPTQIEVSHPPGWPEPSIAYPPGEMKSFSFAEEEISVYEGRVVMVVAQPIPARPEAGAAVLGVALTYQACDDRSCLPPVTVERQVELALGGRGEPTAAAASLAPTTSGPETGEPAGNPSPSLGWLLLLGLLGGLILNAMPCVLPVLSLKIFGLVKNAGQGRRAVVAGALATSAGILFSFWALALVAIAARAGGAAVGWGVQFQEPTFVAALAVIVVLFCLNLWGLFEIPLPGRLAAAAQSASGGTLAGHFGSGLFATLMATPCSAPFLGTAIGFGLSQSAGVILAVFSAIGLGMAVPYLLLAASPGATRFLPRPGAWMGHLKTIMGFLLATAAVWLLYVLAAQITAERLAFFELVLLVMALLVWSRHALGQRRLARLAATLGILLTIAVGFALVGSGHRAVEPGAAASPRLIDWEAFDRAEAERLRGSGRLVFVDVTADWCFTCKVNERLALETPEVAAAFARHDVVAMKADWTNRNDDIARYLAEHGRYGIPFYMLYRPGAPAHLFGELITKQEIVRVVDEAGESTARGQPAD